MFIYQVIFSYDKCKPPKKIGVYTCRFEAPKRKKTEAEDIYRPLTNPVTVHKIALPQRDKSYEPFFQELLLAGPDTSKCNVGATVTVNIEKRSITTRISDTEEVHWKDITHGIAQSVLGDRAKRSDLMKEMMRVHREAFGKKSPLFVLVTFEVV